MKPLFVFLLLIPIAQFWSISEILDYIREFNAAMDQELEGPRTCTSNEVSQLMSLKVRIFFNLLTSSMQALVDIKNAMDPLWTPEGDPLVSMKLVATSIQTATTDYAIGFLQVYNGTAYAIYNTNNVCFNGTNPLVFYANALNASYYKLSA